MASSTIKSHNIIRATFAKEITINGNSYAGVSLSRTSSEELSNYQPIGLSDFNTNSVDLEMYRCDGYWANGDSVYCQLRNLSSNAVTATIAVAIFFMRK